VQTTKTWPGNSTKKLVRCPFPRNSMNRKNQFDESETTQEQCNVL
jgi:hypothetical protein